MSQRYENRIEARRESAQIFRHDRDRPVKKDDIYVGRDISTSAMGRMINGRNTIFEQIGLSLTAVYLGYRLLSGGTVEERRTFDPVSGQVVEENLNLDSGSSYLSAVRFIADEQGRWKVLTSKSIVQTYALDFMKAYENDPQVLLEEMDKEIAKISELEYDKPNPSYPKIDSANYSRNLFVKTCFDPDSNTFKSLYSCLEGFGLQPDEIKQLYMELSFYQSSEK